MQLFVAFGPLHGFYYGNNVQLYLHVHVDVINTNTYMYRYSQTFKVSGRNQLPKILYIFLLINFLSCLFSLVDILNTYINILVTVTKLKYSE